MIIAGEKKRTYEFTELSCWFLIYSFLGWLYETLFCSMEAGRFVNRGFLYGPFCPIYGTCIVLTILLLSNKNLNSINLFLSCSVIACVVEYMVSCSMEYIFNRRWWDYSKRLFNINGRICLGAALIFGLFGVVIIRYFHPALVRHLTMLFPNRGPKRATRLVVAIFLFDVLVSVKRNLP